MRCAYRVLIISLLVVGAGIGCKNQSAPLTNPFLTPDRVPPPSTRVLMPGTAQPYYPGDQMPSAAVGSVPVGGYPPLNAAPPAATYGVPQPLPGTVVPGTVYPNGPVTPAAPATPPGGWGTYPAPGGTAALSNSDTFSIASQAGDAVRVPVDEQGLRFAPPTPQPSLPADPPLVALTAAPIGPQTRMPIQSILPLAQDPRAAGTPLGGAFQPNAGAQAPVQQAGFEAPVAQRLAIREVTAAEYLQGTQPGSPALNAVATSDGFRPQGSSPTVEEPSPQSFRPPEIRRESVAAETTDARFGVDASQESLRGQLEYWPESGEWSLRYIDADGPTDQLGGRVLIDNPQVLGNLPPGEFVVVRGQLFGRQIDASSYRPAYRVATVERQRK